MAVQNSEQNGTTNNNLNYLNTSIGTNWLYHVLGLVSLRIPCHRMGTTPEFDAIELVPGAFSAYHKDP